MGEWFGGHLCVIHTRRLRWRRTRSQLLTWWDTRMCQAQATQPLDPHHEPLAGAVHICLCQRGNRVKLLGHGGHPGRGHCADDHSGRCPNQHRDPGQPRGGGKAMPPTEGSPEGFGQRAGALTSDCTWALAVWKHHFPVSLRLRQGLAGPKSRQTASQGPAQLSRI